MRNILTSLFCTIVSLAYTQADPHQCESPLFADTSVYFLINEVKPLGSGSFVEFWNCRDSAWCADTFMISGIYSGVFILYFSVVIPPHIYTTFSLPAGLGMQDGIRARKSSDTVDRWAMVYTLTDSSRSIGLCEYGYRSMVPTPGQINDCSMVGLEPLFSEDEYTLESLYNSLGSKVVSDQPPPGLYIAVYRNRESKYFVRKIFL